MNENDFARLAGQVARLLGSPWQVTAGYWSSGDCCLAGSAPEILRLTANKGRVHVHGVLPRSELPSESVAISVAAERGAKAVADAIERRLLARYRAALAKVIAFNDRQTLDQEERARNAADIEALFPGAHTRAQGWNGQYTETIIKAPCGASGSVETTGSAAAAAVTLRGVPRETACCPTLKMFAAATFPVSMFAT